MKTRLLLLLWALTGLLSAAPLRAAETESASWKVVVSDATVYRSPDFRSGTLCSPYRYGEILDGVRIENDDWISIPFGSDRRGYVSRSCAAPLTTDEAAEHAARRAEEEARAAAQEPLPDWGEDQTPVRKVYPFFRGIGAGRNAIWFVAALLIVLLVRIVYTTQLPEERQRTAWMRTGGWMVLLAAVEWWYFCSLGFGESLWFLTERQTAHDEWLLLGYLAATVFQGGALLFFLSGSTGEEIESVGFSRRSLILGLLAAALIYCIFAITGFYLISKPVTLLLALAAGLLPHVRKIARRAPGRIAMVYGCALLGTAALLAATFVYVAMLVICSILLLLFLCAVLKDAGHTLTHMEEYSHDALRDELNRAEKAYGEGRIEASKLEEIRSRVAAQLKPKE